MTREEAIEMLNYIKQIGDGESSYKNDAQSIALDMAISALKQYDGMTNREALRTLFPQIELGEIYNGRHRFFLKGKAISTFDLKAEVKWLDSPYKKGGE